MGRNAYVFKKYLFGFNVEEVNRNLSQNESQMLQIPD